MTALYNSIEAVDEHIAALLLVRTRMILAGAPEWKHAAVLHTQLHAEAVLRPAIDIDSIALDAARRIHTQTIAQTQVILLDTLRSYAPGKILRE